MIADTHLDLEENVLGAMLVTERAVDAVLTSGLRAEHLTRPRSRLIYKAIAKLADEGEPIDTLTVPEFLRKHGKLEEVGGADTIHALAASTAVPGNAAHHAARLIEAAEWRARVAAAEAIVTAARSEDPAALADAEAQLAAAETRSSSEFDAIRQAELIWDLAEGNHPAALPWPFPRMTDRCPLRRGELAVLSGYTNTGKSHVADMCLDTWQKNGIPGALYTNEGRVSMRVTRRIQRHTGITARQIERGNLDKAQHEALNRELNRPSWPIVHVAGWTASEVAHHIRRNRPHACVVDLLNRFPIDNRVGLDREYGQIVNVLADAAQQAECAVVLVAQVNRGSVQGHTAARRKPAIFDLKGSADIENAADVVAFIFRDRDPDGEMEHDGEFYFDKTRDGGLAMVPVTFNERYLRFDHGGGA